MKTYTQLFGGIFLLTSVFMWGRVTGINSSIAVYKNSTMKLLKHHDADPLTGIGFDEYMISSPTNKGFPELNLKHVFVLPKPPVIETFELILPSEDESDYDSFEESNPPPELLPVPNRVTI